MTLYILKMDNPKSPTNHGEPTRVQLIGPFDSNTARKQWAEQRINQTRPDDPMWQCVDLTAVEFLLP